MNYMIVYFLLKKWIFIKISINFLYISVLYVDEDNFLNIYFEKKIIR